MKIPCLLVTLATIVGCGAAAGDAEDFDTETEGIDDGGWTLDNDVATATEREPASEEDAQSAEREAPSLGVLEQPQRAVPHAPNNTPIDIDPDRDCVGRYECSTLCLPYFGCFTSCRWVCDII